MTQNKAKYAVLFRKSDSETLARDGGFYTLPIVRISDEDGKPRNGTGEWIEDLVFETFVYISRADKPRFCESLLQYRNAYSVNVHRAELMFKTLKRAGRALDKLPVQPTDFAQYVVLIASALGIDYVISEDRSAGRHSFYTDATYTTRPIQAAQSLVNDELQRVLNAFAERSNVA